MQKALANAALGATIRQGFLIRLIITRSPDPPLVFIVAPDAQVSNIKRLIRKDQGIPEVKQRLSIRQGKPLLHGRLDQQTALKENGMTTSLIVALQIVSEDPDVEPLFALAGFQHWEKRDEIMSRMVTPVKPMTCVLDHQVQSFLLPPPQDQKKEENDPEYFNCVNCKLNHVKPWGGALPYRHCGRRCCRASILCRSCLQSDTCTSWFTPTNNDPYSELATLAKQICHDVAASRPNTMGRRHALLMRRVATAANPSAPELGPRSLVLCKGVRVRIRFADATRQVLLEAGRRPAEIESVEMDHTFDLGVTMWALEHILDSWKHCEPFKSGIIGNTLVRELRRSWFLRETILETECELASFDAKEVVYEVKVHARHMHGPNRRRTES